METDEEHKGLSEVEATANQDQPISNRQQSKEVQEEEEEVSVTAPLPQTTHCQPHSNLISPLSLKERTEENETSLKLEVTRAQSFRMSSDEALGQKKSL